MEFLKLDITTLLVSYLEQMHAIELESSAEPFSVEMLRDCVKNLDAFVCMEQGQVVGFLTMNPSSKKYFDGSIYVVNIQVTSAYRRKGIATQLLSVACQQYALDHREKPVTLAVERNSPARILYQGIGFREQVIHSKNGDGDVVMMVPLSELWGNLKKWNVQRP